MSVSSRSWAGVPCGRTLAEPRVGSKAMGHLAIGVLCASTHVGNQPQAVI